MKPSLKTLVEVLATLPEYVLVDSPEHVRLERAIDTFHAEHGTTYFEPHGLLGDKRVLKAFGLTEKQAVSAQCIGDITVAVDFAELTCEKLGGPLDLGWMIVKQPDGSRVDMSPWHTILLETSGKIYVVHGEANLAVLQARLWLTSRGRPVPDVDVKAVS